MSGLETSRLCRGEATVGSFGLQDACVGGLENLLLEVLLLAFLLLSGVVATTTASGSGVKIRDILRGSLTSDRRLIASLF